MRFLQKNITTHSLEKTKKVNAITTKKQTKEACADLKRAKQLGDDTVDDMIFIHCTSK